ncbi:hypothetical protein, partial [Streptococcus suis]|uniref:hypothetical protein n=1 Tax=Streptococcus suis TaxID=1307 RepID=UPI001EE74061
KDGKKAFLFCPDGVVSALKQPFFSKNSKKDKHQNDVCLQSVRNQLCWFLFHFLKSCFLFDQF